MSQDSENQASSAAEIRALAEEAEAEAAEAEALAAAARARARALALRRKAEAAEAAEAAVAAETAAAADAEEQESAAAETVEAELPAAESESPATSSVVESDGEAIDETADDTAEPAEDTAEPVEDTAEAAEADPDVEETDVEETDVEETDEADAPPFGARKRAGWRDRLPKWSTVAAGVAVLVIIAALSGSVYMIQQHRQADRRRAQAAEFAAAARQGVVNLTSLDFNDARKGVQLILDNATGQFKDDFAKTAEEYIKTVEEVKVHSQGTVQATGVDWESMTDDSAVVLVASTQEVTNASGAKREPRNYRFIVTILRDGGKLKVSRLEFVP